MAAGKDFKWRHFSGEIILWAVRWYSKYGISYRDLEEMAEERGLSVDHTTLYRWVQSYAPEMHKRLKRFALGAICDSWRVDETYIKVAGEWKYLYRAVDKCGNTIDFYLSATRDAKAAKRFLAKALNGLKAWQKPRAINTDKAGCYVPAIEDLKKEGKLPEETEHRQVKYLNNIVEADHGKLKRPIKPTLGFQSMKTAYATIKGFEIMRMIKKKQTRAYHIFDGVKGEIRLIERCFGLGNSVMADLMEFVHEALKRNPELKIAA